MKWHQDGPREIRKFGLIGFIFFGCLSAIGIWLKNPLPAYIFGLLSTIGLCFITIPSQMKPVYVIWRKFGDFLSQAVTISILSLSYYLVITPSGLLKRLIGGRPLPLKPDKKMESYWVAHPELTKTRKERFLKRF
jgi:hypothetical protein